MSLGGTESATADTKNLFSKPSDETEIYDKVSEKEVSCWNVVWNSGKGEDVRAV